MKLLVLLSLVGLTLSQPTYEPISKYYHSSVGIEEAARILASEEAIDFSGNRIAGGSAASLGQYPSYGGLVITLTDGRTSVCGSSLITNTRAVTAAHCWWDGQNQASQFEVVLGSTTLFTGGTRVVSSNVEMHANWNPSTITYDVAVIVLPWVSYTNIIRGVALPSGALLNNDFAGWNAQATGFGRQGDLNPITTSQTLHHVTLQVITNAACQSVFGTTSVISSTICTDGSQRRSTCRGDSGGPLTVNSNGQEVLIGITSFGSIWGCQFGFPAAFARVSYFTSWFQARL